MNSVKLTPQSAEREMEALEDALNPLNQLSVA